MYAQIGWEYSGIEDQSSKQVGYLFSSSVLHVLLFAGMWYFGSLITPIELPPTIEFTVADTRPVKELQAPKGAPAPLVSQQKTAARVARPSAVKQLEPQPLETADVEQALSQKIAISTGKLDDADIEESFAKVDHEHLQKVQALKAQMNQEADQAGLEQEKQIEALKEQTKEENAALAAQAAKVKNSEEAKVRKAQADEAARARAAAVAAEQAQAARAAQARAEAAAAEARAQAEASAKAQKAAQAQAQGAGAADGIRDVSELKAMPGNQQPRYDQADRLAGRQGEVSFMAYVTKDGRVTNFKILKSSGHRQLDAKTFTAIKSWRFYPGQEGWVEIPFRWDLKGGPQEVPATLRRSVSQF